MLRDMCMSLSLFHCENFIHGVFCFLVKYLKYKREVYQYIRKKNSTGIDRKMYLFVSFMNVSTNNTHKTHNNNNNNEINLLGSSK